MQQPVILRDGSNAQPALIAAAVAVAAWAGMQAAGQSLPSEDNSILARVLTDTFSRAILTTAVWACAYGLLQLWGCRSDLGQAPGRIKAWVLARDRTVELASPQITTQAAEFWQTLVRRRNAPLSYAVWILPTMGFLGTVLGISGAIGDMSGVFDQNADRTAALAAVLKNLEFAFDTTFAGLLGAIPVMALLVAHRVASDTAERVVFAGGAT